MTVAVAGATTQPEAVQLKDEANKLFKEGDFHGAIAKYDRAIDICPSDPTFYGNRSFAHTKLENFGYALRDAQSAIDLDPNYVKAYYRRATAHMALLAFKAALEDLRAVVKVAPHDPQAKTKLKECERIVRRISFEKAIAKDETKAAEERIGSIEEMSVEDDYEGPRLPHNVEGGDGGIGITVEFVDKLQEWFRGQKRLHRRYAYSIMKQCKRIFQNLPSLVDVDIPQGATLTVCGDIHGQYYDLLNIFELNGKPSKTNQYLFNGDFVDRGSFSVEVIFLLFAYKALYPDCFHLTRGNHETNDMNKVYGFQGEVCQKHSELMFSYFAEIFNELPLAYTVNRRIFVAHGGLFSKDGVTLDDLRKIERRKQPGSEGLMCELMWSDPQMQSGRGVSKRGVAFQFGPDVTKAFCEENGLDMIIRSHEVREGGYAVEHDGKCITVFSAPNYCDSMGNKGAYIIIDEKTTLTYKTFDAVSHPNVKPMAYSRLQGMGLL